MGQALQHGLVQPQSHHHRGSGHAGNDHAHPPQNAAEIVPPKIGRHGYLRDAAHVKEACEHAAGTYRQTHPGGSPPPFLSRLPEQGGHRAHNEADEQPGGSRFRPGKTSGNALSKPQKPHAPAQGQGQKPPPVPGDGAPGMGQNLHKGTVNIEHHRQYAAGNTGQDGAGADEKTAQQVPQPVHDSILVFAPLQEWSLPTYFLHGSSFALHFQSNTAENAGIFSIPSVSLCLFVYDEQFSLFSFDFHGRFFPLTKKLIACKLRDR